MTKNPLHVPLAEVLADETFIMLRSHVRKQLVRTKESLVTELQDQLKAFSKYK